MNSDGTWTLVVHGQQVNHTTCTPLHSIPSVLQDESAIFNFLNNIDQLRVCPRQPDKHFVELIQKRKGCIKSPDGSLVASIDNHSIVTLNGKKFGQTVRVAKCDLLTNVAECDSYKKYRPTLRAMYNRHVKTSPKRSEKKTRIGSKTNFRYLNTPEKRQRYSNVRAEMEANKRKVEQLKIKVTNLTERDGIVVDEDLDKDLREIMMDNTDEIKKYGADSFEYIFWDQQKEAASQKQRCQIRWHPMMIRWCLHLKFISSSAYDALRSSGIVILPSERTLRDYSNWMPAKSGFTSDVDRQLMKEAKINEIPEYKKYVCLTFDEVKVKEGLIYNKESMEIIGFVNVGDISEHLHEYERCCTEEISQQKPQIATHILMFMVRGLFSGLCFPYAQFPCASLSGDQLYLLVWDCQPSRNDWIQSSCHDCRWGIL